ncbi:MAG: hypothetical protein J7J21_02995 [Methanomicrobia archaeon]|nr:hypothetical protein [Methanomicrobia archaeon]
MFRNKWRKITVGIWSVCIPIALIGGAIDEKILIIIGIAGATAGLILLKLLGR